MTPAINSSSETIEIDYVSPEKLTKIFTILAGQKHIPFNFPNRGCEARAHEMSLILEKMGIASGKIFALGNLRFDTTNSSTGYVDWRFHVAIILRSLSVDKKIEDYVIDPSMFKTPVRVDVWLDKQLGYSQNKLERLVYTPSYVYNLVFNDSYSKISFTEANLDDMQESLAVYLAAEKLMTQNK